MSGYFFRMRVMFLFLILVLAACGGGPDTEDVNQAPDAVITPLNIVQGLAPYTIHLSSNHSTDDSGIVQWQWHVDGHDEMDSAQVEVQLNFSQAGVYTIHLTVTDEQGLSDEDNLVVTVYDPFEFGRSRYAADCSVCHGVNGEGVVGPALQKEWEATVLDPHIQRMVDTYGDCQGINSSDCTTAISVFIIEQFSLDPNLPPVGDFDDFIISVPIKVLSEKEFYQTVESVFTVSLSEEQQALINLPFDTSASRYSTDSQLRVLRGINSDPSVLDDLLPALTRVHNHIVNTISYAGMQNRYGVSAGCDFATVGNSENCRAAYSREILAKAFRRSIDTNDYALTNLEEAFRIFLNDGMSGDDAYINAISSYIVFSPEFVFHGYRGIDTGNGDYLLTNEELAHKIAYLIWGEPADQALLMRDWHTLLLGENDTQLDDELSRLFSDPRSRYFINTFLTQWLQLETDVEVLLNSTADASRSTEFYQAVKGESEHFIRHILLQNDPINRVINADYTFMNIALADYYDIDVPGLTDNYSLVDMSQVNALSNRRGLLTHANFLTTGSKSDRPGSVHRGVTIMKDILCYSLGPPSGETPDISGVDRTLHTEPSLFRMVTETPGSSCLGCHQHINPMSFPFEAFDRFGRHPIDASINGALPEYLVYEAVGIEGNPNANGPVEKADMFFLDVLGGSVDFETIHGYRVLGSFEDHRELIAVIDQSAAFSECLNDNLYDFMVGTNAERGLTASSLEKAEQHVSQTSSKRLALQESSGLRDLIANLLKRPEFRIIQRD